MPSFPSISDSQREALVAFLLELPTEKKYENKEPIVSSPLPDTLKRYRIKGYTQLRDQNDYPGIKPPWGKLCALDLNSGEVKWKVPLGEYPELARQGIKNTGTQLFGGGVVTAGGLVFIGASEDEKFRAFDKENGEILWEYQLPVGGYATPAVYEIDGKQFVVIAAGGGGYQKTKEGDYYIAFSLPGK